MGLVRRSPHKRPTTREKNEIINVSLHKKKIQKQLEQKMRMEFCFLLTARKGRQPPTYIAVLGMPLGKFNSFFLKFATSLSNT
jgi:hypothetical protein